MLVYVEFETAMKLGFKYCDPTNIDGKLYYPEEFDLGTEIRVSMFETKIMILDGIWINKKHAIVF